MLYISRKDNPLMVKAFGKVVSGGLGTFDTTIYEEVQGDLPEGWQQEKNLSPMEAIKEVFQRACVEKPTFMTPTAQKDLLKLADTIERAFTLGLNEAAREAIKEPVLPVELESYRSEMLSMIPVEVTDGNPK